MSTRTGLRPQPVIVNGSMAGNLTSTPTILQSLTSVGYSLSWTGTSPVGTVSIQLSNDYALNPDGRTVENSGTWTTMTVSYNGSNVTTVPVTGNTGTLYIDITKTAGYASRLIYTFTSGTGTLNALINGKVS